MTRIESEEFTLSNAAISYTWRAAEGRFEPVKVDDIASRRSIDLTGASLFRLILDDGTVIAAAGLPLAGSPSFERLPGNPDASTLGQRYPGWQLTARLTAEDGSLDVTWRAILRDDANALRQEFAFTPRGKDIPVKDIVTIDIPSEGAEVGWNRTRLADCRGEPVFRIRASRRRLSGR